MTGVPYTGGVLDIVFALEGSNKIERSWTGEDLEKEANEWTRAAQMDKSAETIKWAVIGAIVAVFFLLLAAVFKARSQGMEVARWEAVGEAEDLSTNTDPDAWNATIFQLTGAMPALSEMSEAAQLGPSTAEPVQPTPEELSDEPPTAVQDGLEESTIDQDYTPGEQEEEIDEEAAAASTSEGLKEKPITSTGMTVGTPF